MEYVEDSYATYLGDNETRPSLPFPWYGYECQANFEVVSPDTKVALVAFFASLGKENEHLGLGDLVGKELWRTQKEDLEHVPFLERAFR